jgi:hypothetical protein
MFQNDGKFTSLLRNPSYDLQDYQSLRGLSLQENNLNQ